MRALILEHRHHQHQQLLVCRHTPKTENKKRDFSYRQRKGERRGEEYFYSQKKRESLNFFFFFGQNAEKTNADTRERGEARDETVDDFY